MPVALKRLAIARVVVGLIFLVRTTPVASWLGFAWGEQALMGSGGGGWHPVPFAFALPAGALMAFAIVRTLAALAFCVGFQSRWAGIAASALGYLALEQDPMSYVNSLHLLFSSTLLLALADSQTTLAIGPRPASSPRTSVWLIRGLAMSVYAFSGLAKLNSDFLSGHALTTLHTDGELTGAIADLVCASFLRTRAISILAAAFELLIPWLLMCRRTRRAAVIVALAFHLLIEQSMHPDVFGWLMVTLLFTFASTQARSVSAQESADRARQSATRETSQISAAVSVVLNLP